MLVCTYGLEAVILAVSVTLLMKVTVTSDINGVDTVANGIGFDFDAVNVVGKPEKEVYTKMGKKKKIESGGNS